MPDSDERYHKFMVSKIKNNTIRRTVIVIFYPVGAMLLIPLLMLFGALRWFLSAQVTWWKSAIKEW